MDIRHHFIKDHVEKKNKRMEKIHIDRQQVDILAKPLAEARFRGLSIELGLLDPGDAS